jgi:hypothetical protein
MTMTPFPVSAPPIHPTSMPQDSAPLATLHSFGTQEVVIVVPALPTSHMTQLLKNVHAPLNSPKIVPVTAWAVLDP